MGRGKNETIPVPGEIARRTMMSFGRVEHVRSSEFRGMEPAKVVLLSENAHMGGGGKPAIYARIVKTEKEAQPRTHCLESKK